MKKRRFIPFIIIIFLFCQQKIVQGGEQGVNSTSHSLNFEIAKLPVTKGELPIAGEVRENFLIMFGLAILIFLVLRFCRKRKLLIVGLFVIVALGFLIFQRQAGVFAQTQTYSGETSLTFVGHLTPKMPRDIDYGSISPSDKEEYLGNQEPFVIEVEDERETTVKDWQLQAKLEIDENDKEKRLDEVDLLFDARGSTSKFTNEFGSSQTLSDVKITNATINDQAFTTVAQVGANPSGERGNYRFEWQEDSVFLKIPTGIPVGKYSVVTHWLTVEGV
ncbi:MAG: hypothetical protein LBS33_05885 [Streptococcaceae bacterium]|jgi:hypothetical protein|nr:hypothetical protein [Streptococcaceae bacterium]